MKFVANSGGHCVHNLFLIDGVSATGKTDLLNYIQQEYREPFAHTLRKLTTRDMRARERITAPTLDLEFVKDPEFNERIQRAEHYTYEYGTNRNSQPNRYAFSKEALNNSVRDYLNTFLILRSRTLIKVLQEQYEHARVIPVLVYSDRQVIAQRLQQEKEELDKGGHQAAANEVDDEIRQRSAERAPTFWKDYLREPFLYAAVIINSTTRQEYQTIIERLIDKYNPTR